VTSPARRTAVERQPKYLRIYTELRDRIEGGRWPAGTALPAQRELADEFGVSMMTLRQAVQLLADEGLVGTRHGLGTYVTPRFAHDLGARLGGPARALRLRRLRLVGGQPVILQTSWLPVPLPGGLDPRDLLAEAGPQPPSGPGPAGGDRGLYTLLADRGLAVARASETITPTALSPADARDLGRQAGTLALLSHRVSFTAAGDPLIDDHALLPGDSVALTANRSADQVEVSYTLAPPPARS
jgi:GntR family transcriptional regulator